MNSGNLRAIEPFRLVQLSDCHLSADPAADYRGGRSDEGLCNLLEGVTGWRPHALLVTGDVSEDVSAESYARAAEWLGRLAETLVALPGNHDDPAAMWAQFPRGPWDGPLVVAAGSWQLVLLDTCVPGRVDGRIRETDIDWLRDWLQAHRNSPVLIALHHHPVPVGSPWIDRYMLAEPEALLRLIESNECVRCVVYGHVHQAFEARCGAAQLHACPSTAVNSLPGTERFTTDPAGPAARWLELYPDGSLCTGLLRAAAVSGAAAPATE